MRVVYVGKHCQAASNDDEGAVSHALRLLGHEVVELQECHTTYRHVNAVPGVDLVLFNKWDCESSLKRIRAPKVFWNWDLVDSALACEDRPHHPDPTLAARNQSRRQWMRDIVPLVDLGFLTDGDWVRQDLHSHSGSKLHWLPQGADERMVRRGSGGPNIAGEKIPPHLLAPEVLMLGSVRKCGVRRQSFVDEMREKWGDRFRCVERGLHGHLLRELVSRAKVVVAPDFPVSDRYWSNRCYLMLGFGAFLLHPWSAGLAEQYQDGADFLTYNTRPFLHLLIDKCLSDRCREDYLQISTAGLSRTRSEHTYRHRLVHLLKVVEERLGVK